MNNQQICIFETTTGEERKLRTLENNYIGFTTHFLCVCTSVCLYICTFWRLVPRFSLLSAINIPFLHTLFFHGPKPDIIFSSWPKISLGLTRRALLKWTVHLSAPERAWMVGIFFFLGNHFAFHVPGYWKIWFWLLFTDDARCHSPSGRLIENETAGHSLNVAINSFSSGHSAWTWPDLLRDFFLPIFFSIFCKLKLTEPPSDCWDTIIHPDLCMEHCFSGDSLNLYVRSFIIKRPLAGFIHSLKGC